MNLRGLAVVAGVLVIGCVLGYRAGSAEPPVKPGSDSLAVRYARAQLQLAEATLRKAQDMNRKVGATVSPDLVAQFADDVQVAKAQLQSVEESGHVDLLAASKVRADYAVRAAEARLRKAEEVNKIAPKTFSAVDLDRLRLGVVVAQLQVERGASLAKAPIEEKLRWQLDLLNDELTRLKDRTAIVFQNRGPNDF